MKLTKMLKKAGRTALILAMAISLCGTTLCKAFATYVPYIVNVEHIFHDYKNGAEVETGEYSPRDDLINGLDGKANGEPGALNVEYGPSTESPKGNISLNGTETGESIGWDDASKAAVKEWLKNELDDNKDGNEALKNTLENIYKEYDEACDGEPWGCRPEGKEPTSIPELPTAEVKDPGEEPEEPESRREDESEEDYEARLTEHEKELEAWENARSAYEADQARLAEEQAAYDEAMELCKNAYNEWVAGLEYPEDAEDIESWLESWREWKEYEKNYQEWEKGYLETLQKVLEELRGLVGEDGLDAAVEITDKNLLSGYEKARLEVVWNCLWLGYDYGSESIDWDAVMDGLDEGSESYENSGIEINTWKDVDGATGEHADGTQNLFEFKAWLDESSKAALEAGDYTTGNDGNPTRITVVCVKYDVMDEINDEGETVLKFVDVDGKGCAIADEDAGTKTYISLDNGETWYESDAFDENGKVKAGAEGIKTEDINLEKGWFASAVTFTFDHYWGPTPDTPVVELPEDPVPEESEKPEDPEPEVSETPDEPEPEVSETPEEPVEDPETPLGEPPEETEVDEPDVPLSDIPQTGDISGLWYAAALVAAVGLMGLLYQDRREKKND